MPFTAKKRVVQFKVGDSVQECATLFSPENPDMPTQVHIDASSGNAEEIFEIAKELQDAIYRRTKSLWEPVVIGPLTHRDADLIEKLLDRNIRSTSFDFEKYVREMFGELTAFHDTPPHSEQTKKIRVGQGGGYNIIYFKVGDSIDECLALIKKDSPTALWQIYVDGASGTKKEAIEIAHILDSRGKEVRLGSGPLPIIIGVPATDGAVPHCAMKTYEETSKTFDEYCSDLHNESVQRGEDIPDQGSPGAWLDRLIETGAPKGEKPRRGGIT